MLATGKRIHVYVHGGVLKSDTINHICIHYPIRIPLLNEAWDSFQIRLEYAGGIFAHTAQLTNVVVTPVRLDAVRDIADDWSDDSVEEDDTPVQMMDACSPMIEHLQSRNQGAKITNLFHVSFDIPALYAFTDTTPVILRFKHNGLLNWLSLGRSFARITADVFGKQIMVTCEPTYLKRLFTRKNHPILPLLV
jgi:hypothetical protein